MAPSNFSTEQLPTRLFINNEYVESKTSRVFSVYNPKDNSLVSDRVPIAGREDVDAAVAAAEAAFPAWKALTALERRTILTNFASLLEQNAVMLAELTRITMGAPYKAFGEFETGLFA